MSSCVYYAIIHRLRLWHPWLSYLYFPYQSLSFGNFFRHSKTLNSFEQLPSGKKKIIIKFSSPPSALHFVLLSLTLFCKKINQREIPRSKISEIHILNSVTVINRCFFKRKKRKKKKVSEEFVVAILSCFCLFYDMQYVCPRFWVLKVCASDSDILSRGPLLGSF